MPPQHPQPHYATYEPARQPERPVLVVALEGWVDAGMGASAATSSLLATYPAEVVAGFDGDYFLDQRARRPFARIVDGVTEQLTWPQIELRAGQDADDADVLYLVGPEPDFHWREFVDDIVGLAIGFGVRMVVGLGAFPAPAPHTRPVKLAATAPAPSSSLIAQVGVVQGEIEIPAGVQAALELGFASAGIDIVTLWARVPHYVSAMAFPEASAALVEGLTAISGLALDATPLRHEADTTRHHIDELIAGNAEHAAMVRNLEQSIDASEGNPLGLDEMPSGDEIAAELERFLREEG